MHWNPVCFSSSVISINDVTGIDCVYFFHRTKDSNVDPNSNFNSSTNYFYIVMCGVP